MLYFYFGGGGGGGPPATHPVDPPLETAAFLGLNISFLFTVRASANPYSPDVNFYVAVAARLISKSTKFVSEGPCLEV